MSRFRYICIYLMYISVMINIRSSLTHLHCFQLFVLHFFGLYQQNESSDSKSWDRLEIVAKRFLKLPNLHMLIKQKSPSLPRKLALGTFGKLLKVFSTKTSLLHLLYSITQVLFFASAKDFSKKSNLKYFCNSYNG